MSEHKISLAVAYLKSHPESAASILEQQSPKDAAVFLSQIPATNAADVLRKMLPNYAAQLCTEVPIAVGIGILMHLAPDDTANVLRHIPRKHRGTFLKELPIRTQVTCKLIFGYSEEMVGAFMTTAVATLPYEAKVAEAIQVVKATTGDAPSDYIFVVDHSNKLKGQLPLIELLRHPGERSINAIIETNIKTVLGRSNIKDALSYADWEQNDIIAVENRNRDFIGVLRYADWRRAIKGLDEHVETDEKPELVTGIAQGYVQSLSALFVSMKEFAMSDLEALKGGKHD